MDPQKVTPENLIPSFHIVRLQSRRALQEGKERNIMSNADLMVTIDDKEIHGIYSLKFEVESGRVSRLTLTMAVKDMVVGPIFAAVETQEKSNE